MAGTPRRALVTYGSKREGTREIASAIADELRARGLEVDCIRASLEVDVSGYDAVVIGGALYSNRWHADARRFVTHHVAALRTRPVWMFSSGPLVPIDNEIPATHQVEHLRAYANARGHRTFGGRLARDARGFAASIMARSAAGDFRDWDAIRSWADEIAAEVLGRPPTSHAVVRELRRWPLALLCAVVGITAVLGGSALVMWPDGSALRMPTSYLRGTPFDSYLVPGLLLAVVIGAGHLLVFSLVVRRSRLANLGGMLAGGALTVWITAQMALLGTTNNLQLLTLAVATITVGESLRRVTALPMARPQLA